MKPHELAKLQRALERASMLARDGARLASSYTAQCEMATLVHEIGQCWQVCVQGREADIPPRREGKLSG